MENGVDLRICVALIGIYNVAGPGRSGLRLRSRLAHG